MIALTWRHIAFFIAAAAVVVAAGIWYWQQGSFSKEVVRLEILGPDNARLGEEVEYIVKFKNSGSVNLETAKLIFEYPDDSQVADQKPLRQEIDLEVIYPGQERTMTFQGRLFGEEGENKVATAWLNYRPKDLKGQFESVTTKTTTLSTVPFTLDIDIPTKVEAGKEVSFHINYFSNIEYPLTDIMVQAEYPSGFEFIRSVPFSAEKTEWDIDLLNKTEGGRITVTGSFSGSVGQERLLRARVGVWQGDNFIVLQEAIKGVQIVRPSLFITQEINNNPRYIAASGDVMHYEVFFKNIGTDPLTNLFMVVQLEGDAIDFDEIKAPDGRFKSGDNSIIFDSRDVSDLAFLDGQAEGKVEFWIELRDEWQIAGPNDKDHEVKNTILLSQAREEFSTKINSTLQLEQTAVFDDEVFGNDGPVPPEKGETTTYTVTWQVGNLYNDVDNVTVRTTLPDDVKMTGEFFPEDANITFDSGSREVVWDVGDLDAGQGVLGDPVSAAFQIELEPSDNGSDGFHSLLAESLISGEDNWTRQRLFNTATPVVVEAAEEGEE